MKKLISTLIISTSSKMVLQGHQLFDAHEFATPRATLDPGTIPDAVPLTMDMCEGGGFIAVATRDVRDPTRVTRKKKPATKQAVSLDSADGPDGSDDTDYSESDASTTSAEDSAYETCSNGSTDVDGASDSDGSSDTLSGEDHDSHDAASISSDSEGEPRTEARPALMRVRPGGESAERTVRLANDPMKEKEQDRPTYPGRPDRLRGPGDRLTATLNVYRLNANGKSTRVFHHKNEIPTLLFCSPPEFHRNEPLVVWPLGGREVLFADFEEKTYFVRTTMPTRPGSEFPTRCLVADPGCAVLLMREIPRSSHHLHEAMFFTLRWVSTYR